MFQEDKISLKQDIAFALAVAAAGFKLTNSKSVQTDDGACWQATLVHGRAMIVTVSNGGYGGPDECQFHATTDAAKAAAKASLEKLFAVPDVLLAVRGYLVSGLNLERQFEGLSEADYEAKKAEIFATVPTPTNDNVEFLVSRIADIDGAVASFKRAMKTKLLVVFEGDDEKGQYMTYKLPDTPESRARVKEHVKRKIDYFIADLFGAANQPTGA
jgi:hypothetical protein